MVLITPLTLSKSDSTHQKQPPAKMAFSVFACCSAFFSVWVLMTFLLSLCSLRPAEMKAIIKRDITPVILRKCRRFLGSCSIFFFPSTLQSWLLVVPAVSFCPLLALSHVFGSLSHFFSSLHHTEFLVLCKE